MIEMIEKKKRVRPGSKVPEREKCCNSLWYKELAQNRGVVGQGKDISFAQQAHLLCKRLFQCITRTCVSETGRYNRILHIPSLLNLDPQISGLFPCPETRRQPACFYFYTIAEVGFLSSLLLTIHHPWRIVSREFCLRQNVHSSAMRLPFHSRVHAAVSLQKSVIRRGV
jgi:hypothetical protein